LTKKFTKKVHKKKFTKANFTIKVQDKKVQKKLNVSYLTPPSKYISRYWSNALFISTSNFRRKSDGTALKIRKNWKKNIENFTLTRLRLVGRIRLSTVTDTNRHPDYNRIRDNPYLSKINKVLKSSEKSSKKSATKKSSKPKMFKKTFKIKSSKKRSK